MSARIYRVSDDSVMTDGLQSSAVCDVAIQVARKMAAEEDEPMVVDEGDGDATMVYPDGSTAPAEWTDGDGWRPVR